MTVPFPAVNWRKSDKLLEVVTYRTNTNTASLRNRYPVVPPPQTLAHESRTKKGERPIQGCCLDPMLRNIRAMSEMMTATESNA